MAIKNYTFFSPTGTEFPVSATADRRLYLMLAGMTYDNFKMKNWTTPASTGLNRVYNDTSFVIAGAYFELKEQTVTVSANSVSYIHANIDLSSILAPVFLTVEKQDNSNNIDINSTSGILKRCFEIVTSGSTAILTTQVKTQDSDLIKQLKLSMNPIGTILTTTNSANPETYIGGTWERYGQGRVLVGVDENDSDFSSADKTGGEKTHALRVEEIPSHTHTFSRYNPSGTGYDASQRKLAAAPNNATGVAGGVDSNPTGGDKAHNNLQPYVAVYIWHRMA